MAMSQSQTLTMLSPIQLLPGYRFNPDDKELLRFYLYPKLTNPCFTTSAPVRDCSLYAYQPLQIWNTFHRLHGEDVFFFTDLKKIGPESNNVSRKIAGGPATWHREDKDHHIRVQIDKNYSVTALRKGFSYRNTQPHQPGCNWMMYEYSLPSLSEVTVLCQLRRKDNDKTTQKNKKRKRAKSQEVRVDQHNLDDGVDDAANTKSQKARVDQHNLAPYRASETVSEDVVNGVRFEDFESFYCENMPDFDSCEMAANSITSTTVSTLNPAENLKPFEVLSIDSDGEAADKEDDHLRQEILERLNSTFFYDEVDIVPVIEAAPVQADGVPATQVGSTLIESFTSEVVDYHPESEVPADSSLSSEWIQSFPPELQQANPTCCMIQENKIQMIPNPFFKDCFY